MVLSLSIFAEAQGLERNFPIQTGGLVEVRNLYGRIDIQTSEEQENEATLKIETEKSFAESDLKIKNSATKIKIEILPQDKNTRVDLTLKVPARTKVRLETDAGQIHVGGDLKEIDAESNTGTLYADIPLKDVKYKFLWWASRPRFVSDVKLEEVKEKAAGKFVISGKIKEDLTEEAAIKEPEIKVKDGEVISSLEESIEESSEEDSKEKSDKKKKKKKKKNKDNGQISINLRTARGIILLNTPPNEVPSDLSERPLTNAAKAVIRSGDLLLTNAIRRASPKFFGEYAATLPPRKDSPFFSTSADKKNTLRATIKKVNVQVVDINNRAVFDLSEKDFVLTERGDEREILSIEKTNAPFNLVLLLDVSGSIENYVDFIRKAARNFVNTVGAQDKLSIVIFNEDVKTLSTFTTDKNTLSESLDTFDAGGGTAYYDSIAYVLTDTLRPMKGERTAIVVLSDGDDNRSFLPFKSLLGSLQESGALVYPLYVPSGLIAASDAVNPNNTVDPLRSRFLAQTLSSKAQEEGETLAKISGGVYYPISRLSELQNAYNDIVKQLRTAYTITYRSGLNRTNGNSASPRLKVKVKKENTFVKLGTVVAVKENQVSQEAVKKNSVKP